MGLQNHSHLTYNQRQGRYCHGRLGSLTDVTYEDLVATLGSPGPGCGKTQAEWYIEDAETGVRFSIWDYKSYKPVHQVTNWSVGWRNGFDLVPGEEADPDETNEVTDLLRRLFGDHFAVDRWAR